MSTSEVVGGLVVDVVVAAAVVVVMEVVVVAAEDGGGGEVVTVVASATIASGSGAPSLVMNPTVMSITPNKPSSIWRGRESTSGSRS